MALPEKINIPQKPPMVMVDRVLECGNGTTVTSFLVREDNIFNENGRFREPGLIENIAQSAAAGISGSNRGEDGNPRTGFIGAIKDLSVSRLPSAGDEIRTTVTVTHEIFNASVVEGRIMLGDELIARCEMRIFLEPAGS